MKPEISVIMSVFNTPTNYLKEAIESILNQTFNNFEFLIIDDASTEEGTKKLLQSYKDKRIFLFRNEENKGLTKNLNILLEMAQGKYIARMDADDISMPQRFEKQYKYLEKYKKVHVLGCIAKCDVGYHLFGGNMKHSMRKVKMLFYNAGLCHPSIMIRKSFLDKHFIRYDETMLKAQDYALWLECMNWTNLLHYPEPLIYYREHDKQISKNFRNGVGGQKDFAREIRETQLKQAGVKLNSLQLDVFFRIGEEDYKVEPEIFETLFESLLLQNKIRNNWSQKDLRYELQLFRIKIICANNNSKVLNLEKIKVIISLLSPSFIGNLIYRYLLTKLYYNKRFFNKKG